MIANSLALRIGFAALAATGAAIARQQPTFRTTTDVVLVDVHVVAKDGTPVAGLKPEQFEVQFDGRKRQVVAAEFLRGEVNAMVAGGAPAVGAPGAAPAPFSDGRVFVVAVDQPSFPLAAQSSAREAVRRVIEAVKPEDYLGLVAFPGKSIVAPTRDRQVIRAAAEQIQGQRFEIRTKHNVSSTEAGIIKSGDRTATNEIFRRECPLNSSPDCMQSVKLDADLVIAELHRQASGSISGLHSVIDGMATLPGRKTLLVISAGLPMSSRPGVEPNVNVETNRLAAHAASANVNLYVFFMNVHFLRAFSAEFGRINNTLFQDMDVFATGLERFAGAANGSFFQIQVNADPFIARVMRETSAYYLLQVAPDARDRDGKEHFIRVTVKQGGTTVRHRTIVTIPTK